MGCMEEEEIISPVQQSTISLQRPAARCFKESLSATKVVELVTMRLRIFVNLKAAASSKILEENNNNDITLHSS